MAWPLSSLDLNPIENLCSIVKMKLYEGGKQYNNKADLCVAIKTAMSEIKLAEVYKKLRKSTNNRFLAFIEKY